MENEYKCDICFKNFSSKSHLKRHKNIIHSNEKPFRCPDCEFVCKRKDNLNQHKNIIHSDIKPFKCSECEFTCKTKGTLTRHKNDVHSNEKPFRCPDCDFSCKRNGVLTRHIYLMHINPKNPKMSRGEKLIFDYLTEKKINFVTQKRFELLRGEHNYLRYDFYLVDLNILIEFHGAQHYEFTEHFHGTLEKFKLFQKYDALKKEYAEVNGIGFVEIRFDDKDWKDIIKI